MSFQDEWSHDPSVQMMRRIFSQMEKAQEELLEDLSISPYDQRLRDARKQAQILFERLWPDAARQGIVVGEKGAVLLYIHCLARTLSQGGVEVPVSVLQDDKDIIRFIEEGSW